MTVHYMKRSRDYYRAHGYERDYEWAHFEDVPFARLDKPLEDCTIGLVTTANPMDAPTERAVFSRPTVPAPEALYTENRFWDKDATHTEDLDSYCPINRLTELASEGRIGALARRFYFVPTDYSQRRTREVDAPKILELCREDHADAVVLTPL
jgi:D-proline reductase (dithiol) PrdB